MSRINSSSLGSVNVNAFAWSKLICVVAMAVSLCLPRVGDLKREKLRIAEALQQFDPACKQGFLSVSEVMQTPCLFEPITLARGCE